jgi:hypothetical protein
MTISILHAATRVSPRLWFEGMESGLARRFQRMNCPAPFRAGRYTRAFQSKHEKEDLQILSKPCTMTLFSKFKLQLKVKSKRRQKRGRGHIWRGRWIQAVF